MRFLMGLVATLVLALSATGASAGAPPGSGYAWAQPGAASVVTLSVQPPAWIFAFTLPSARPGVSTYVWVQPPAWIPI